jgi:hypothetical protein
MPAGNYQARKTPGHSHSTPARFFRDDLATGRVRPPALIHRFQALLPASPCWFSRLGQGKMHHYQRAGLAAAVIRLVW